jgi:hypothetical protein
LSNRRSQTACLVPINLPYGAFLKPPILQDGGVNAARSDGCVIVVTKQEEFVALMSAVHRSLAKSPVQHGKAIS